MARASIAAKDLKNFGERCATLHEQLSNYSETINKIAEKQAMYNPKSTTILRRQKQMGLGTSRLIFHHNMQKLKDRADEHGGIFREYIIPKLSDSSSGPWVVEYNDGVVMRYDYDGGDIITEGPYYIEKKKPGGKWTHARRSHNETTGEDSILRHEKQESRWTRLIHMFDKCLRCESVCIDGHCFTCEKAEKIINNPDLRQVYVFDTEEEDPLLKKWHKLIRAINAFQKEREGEG